MQDDTCCNDRITPCLQEFEGQEDSGRSRAWTPFMYDYYDYYYYYLVLPQPTTTATTTAATTTYFHYY